MVTLKRGQNIGTICWTPLEAAGWVTACVPLDTGRELLEVFEWQIAAGGERPTNDNDEEAGQWGEITRHAQERWAKDNPY